MTNLRMIFGAVCLLALGACGYGEKLGKGVDSTVEVVDDAVRGTMDHLAEGG